MTKYKFFINFDKEEKWLSDMAKQGYELKSVLLGYTFSKVQPEDAVIKIDYRVFKDHKSFLDYCTLFEDSGWKHIAGTKLSGAQYFKKINDMSNEDIFSDSFSRAGRYKRLSNMWLLLAIVFLPLLTINSNPYEILNPKAWYLTPGLWEMSGSDFWRRFLFETPFALLRGFSSFFWVAIVLMYVFFAIKSWRLYKNTLNVDAKIK